MAERVAIFDTTLRDGEQSPGASMNAHEKIQMALQLERLGVDVIEAGFPIASQQEFESVQQIAATVQKPGVAALARAVDKDIERAAAALEKAVSPTLHTFIATSDIHLEHKLRMTRDQVLEQAGKACVWRSVSSAGWNSPRRTPPAPTSTIWSRSPRWPLRQARP